MPEIVMEPKVRNVLKRAGWRFVGKKDRVARLNELLDSIYVDNRRRSVVAALEEARQIARSL